MEQLTMSSPADEQPASPLVQRVFQHVQGRIASGEFPAFSRLPSEHVLSAAYGVSRPVVRQALQRLKAAGLVFSRQGAGTFVREVNLAAPSVLGFAPAGTLADVQRCYEFRAEIEPASAYYAASRHRPESLGAIEKALGLLLDTTHAHAHREDADYSFHIAVAKACGNAFILSSMEALRENIYVAMKLHGLSLLTPAGDLAGVFEEHRAIYEAIQERRADDAREAMRRHIRSSYDRLFGGMTPDFKL